MTDPTSSKEAAPRRHYHTPECLERDCGVGVFPRASQPAPADPDSIGGWSKCACQPAPADPESRPDGVTRGRWVAKNGPHVYAETPDWPTFDPTSGYANPPSALVADFQTEADARWVAQLAERASQPAPADMLDRLTRFSHRMEVGGKVDAEQLRKAIDTLRNEAPHPAPADPEEVGTCDTYHGPEVECSWCRKYRPSLYAPADPLRQLDAARRTGIVRTPGEERAYRAGFSAAGRPTSAGVRDPEPVVMVQDFAETQRFYSDERARLAAGVRDPEPHGYWQQRALEAEAQVRIRDEQLAEAYAQTRLYPTPGRRVPRRRHTVPAAKPRPDLAAALTRHGARFGANQNDLGVYEVWAKSKGYAVAFRSGPTLDKAVAALVAALTADTHPEPKR